MHELSIALSMVEMTTEEVERLGDVRVVLKSHFEIDASAYPAQNNGESR